MSLLQGSNMYLRFIVLVMGKAVTYMTIRLTVLYDIQPLLSSLMICPWSVFDLLCPNVYPHHTTV